MLKKTTRSQKLGWVLFLAYLALLVYFMFFSESFGRDPAQRDYAYNLELFKEIRGRKCGRVYSLWFFSARHSEEGQRRTVCHGPVLLPEPVH